MLTLIYRRRHRLCLALCAVLLIIMAAQPAYASVNLVVNPGLETLDATGFPLCWEASGWGNNNYSDPNYVVWGNADAASSSYVVWGNSVPGGGH